MMMNEVIYWPNFVSRRINKTKLITVIRKNKHIHIHVYNSTNTLIWRTKSWKTKNSNYQIFTTDITCWLLQLKLMIRIQNTAMLQ